MCWCLSRSNSPVRGNNPCLRNLLNSMPLNSPHSVHSHRVLVNRIQLCLYRKKYNTHWSLLLWHIHQPRHTHSPLGLQKAGRFQQMGRPSPSHILRSSSLLASHQELHRSQHQHRKAILHRALYPRYRVHKLREVSDSRLHIFFFYNL